MLSLKTIGRKEKTTPEQGNHDPSALSTFHSLPGHDLLALPSDYECREALDVSHTISKTEGCESHDFKNQMM